MRQRSKIGMIAGTGLFLAWPGAAATMRADLEDTNGNAVGSVMAETTESGHVLVSIDISGLPPGVRGVHFHETGDCSATGFESAGGHLAGDAEHGVRSGNGPHPGDLPNLHITEDGTAQVEHFLTDLDSADFVDADGAAVIVHGRADDYESQPAGDAGDRIACGVFTEE